jgi:hypothetical protein
MLTTYHLHVPIVKKSGGINLLEPCGPVMGQLYLLAVMRYAVALVKAVLQAGRLRVRFLMVSMAFLT